MYNEALSLFEGLATDVWGRLCESPRLNITQGEVTITENMLLMMVRRGIRCISVEQTSLKREAVVGTDWEWWIRTNYACWRFAVQAKKLHPVTHSYTHLDYKVQGILQIDTLMYYASESKAIPLYCLYNYYKESKEKHFNCKLSTQSEERYKHLSISDAEQLGCSLVRAETLKPYVSKGKHRGFDVIHRNDGGPYGPPIPLRCMFHPSCFARMCSVDIFDEENYQHDENFKQLLKMPGFYDGSPDFLLNVQRTQLQVSDLDMKLYPATFGPERKRLVPAHILVIDVSDFKT